MQSHAASHGLELVGVVGNGGMELPLLLAGGKVLSWNSL
jgi:hypothetical protein